MLAFYCVFHKIFEEVVYFIIYSTSKTVFPSFPIFFCSLLGNHLPIVNFIISLLCRVLFGGVKRFLEASAKRRPGAISAPCGAPTEPPSVSAFGNAPSLTSFGLSPSVGATWLHTLDAPFRLHAAARLGPRCFRRDCAAAFRLHSAARVFPPPARRRFAGPRATRRHGPAPFLPPSRLSPPRAVTPKAGTSQQGSIFS